MLDIKEIRKNPGEIEKTLRGKIENLSLKEILHLDELLRLLKTEAEQIKAEKNLASKEIGRKKQRGEAVEKSLEKVEALKQQASLLESRLEKVEKDLQKLLDELPNIPMNDVPHSLSAEDNRCIKTWKKPPSFSFAIKNHVELNEKLKLFDFARGAKIAGSGWPLYTGRGASIEWALLNYMLDVHKKNGFSQIIPPLLVHPEAMYGSGQLPKFASQLFQIRDADYHLYLIPTSEVSLNGMHLGDIFEEKQLDRKYVCYTPCFRREAGAAGSQERGLIRTHQFNKVEMFCITTPERSASLFEGMVRSAEEILEGLDLHYRSMLLSTGDMSFAAAKTVDIEVFLPGQNRYYEVSSVSNCTDFQARRSKIRYKNAEGKLSFVHTLNGSGLATSRLMVAILENNQREDGSVLVPKVLEKYLGGESLSLQ